MSFSGVREALLAAEYTLAVILLFVKVFVLEIVGIVTHSTAITQAETRESVVSVACQSSIVLICGAVLLTSPPVPVELAPQRVSTIADTVASSSTVAAAAVIVMFASGIVIVFSVVVGQLILVNPFPVPPYVEAIT